MMSSPESNSLIQLENYNFNLPPELIAQNRDSSNNRLLVVDVPNNQLIVSKTSLLDKFLPQEVRFFFNATLVLPTRHLFKNKNGRVHEVLFVDQDYDDLPRLKAKVRNLSKLRIGEELFSHGVQFKYVARDNQLCILEGPFLNRNEIVNFHKSFGLAPSPPYMKQVEKKEDYQNPLGDLEESVAAPTSCYHFTKEVLEKFPKENFNKLYLRVGLGTFEPVTSWDHLHYENFEIPSNTAKVWENTPPSQRCVVGTTALRTLESSLRQKTLKGKTNLFLKPENPPQLSFEYLLTNFHLPKSSLFVLICSIVGRDLALRAYEKAIEERFKFFSFGDAMLIRRGN